MFNLNRMNFNKFKYLNKEIHYQIKFLIARFLYDRDKKPDFDLKCIKNILIIENSNKLNYVLIDTIFIRELRAQHYNVDILVSNECAKFLMFNLDVRSIYTCKNVSKDAYFHDMNHSVSKETINTLKNNKYDLIIDPVRSCMPIHRMKLYEDISPKYIVGFNKKIKRYSKSVSFEPDSKGVKHIKYMCSTLLKELGLKCESIEYDIHYPKEIDDEIKLWFTGFSESKIIVLNTSSNHANKNLSPKQISNIIIGLKCFNCRIILLDPLKIMDNYSNTKVTKFLRKNIHYIVSLIKYADLIISPDADIIHIAACYNKTLISLHQNLDYKNIIWNSGYDNSVQILAEGKSISEDDNIVEGVIYQVNKIANTWFYST